MENKELTPLDATPRMHRLEVGQRQLYKVDLQDGTLPKYVTLQRHDWKLAHRTVSYYVKVSTGEIVPLRLVEETPFLALIDCTSPSRLPAYAA